MKVREGIRRTMAPEQAKESSITMLFRESGVAWPCSLEFVGCLQSDEPQIREWRGFPQASPCWPPVLFSSEMASDALMGNCSALLWLASASRFAGTSYRAATRTAQRRAAQSQ